MLATEWGRVLKSDGVKVFGISPGVLNTGLGRDRETGEARELERMGALRAEVGGGDLRGCGGGGEGWGCVSC